MSTPDEGHQACDGEIEHHSSPEHSPSYGAVTCLPTGLNAENLSFLSPYEGLCSGDE
jgi:hypothetical protein